MEVFTTEQKTIQKCLRNTRVLMVLGSMIQASARPVIIHRIV